MENSGQTMWDGRSTSFLLLQTYNSILTNLKE
jgi:hypothetical protein